MAVTPSEWALLRALAWHRVMLVPLGGKREREAVLLKQRNLPCAMRHDERRATIRITGAGLAMAAKIEKELRNAN